MAGSRLSDIPIGQLTVEVRKLDPTRQRFVADGLSASALAGALANLRSVELEKLVAALPKETRQKLRGSLKVTASGYPEIRMGGGEVTFER